MAHACRVTAFFYMLKIDVAALMKEISEQACIQQLAPFHLQGLILKSKDICHPFVKLFHALRYTSGCF